MRFQPAHHFTVCVFNTAEIPAEAILIQLLTRGCIPKAAGIGADLVGKNDAAVRQPSELQFEVYQCNAALFSE